MLHRPFMAALLGAALLIGSVPAVSAQDRSGTDVSAPRRARITIYPQNRPLGPNAKRQCTAWLEKEYRVSGTVIVPRERCWWE